MPQQVTVNKGDSITITVESLEAYPFTLEYEDVLGFAINRVAVEHNQAQQEKAKQKALAAAQEAKPLGAPPQA